MRRTSSLVALALAALALGGVRANPANQAAITDPALDALDPTRAGRLACRGLDASTSTLAARLAAAENLALAQGMGSGAIGLYQGIAPTDLPLGAIDPAARPYFDQGLALAYGFNHRAAIRSFRKAQAIDPDCALCWWGEALANGPNINAGMDSAQNRAALAALEQAQRLAAKAPPLARQLIEAQARRYSPAEDADRAALDRDYAEAMLAMARANPGIDDLAILAAESAMNTTPWNYWDPATGEARPLVAPAVSLVETVMARSPAHPQASHLYIHLLEARDPTRAEAAADRLQATGPRALGHLVHMPSHIYFRLGRYADSVKANRAAVAADEAYLAQVRDDGLMRYGYYPHNVHFLLTSAQMMGDVDTVISQTAKLQSILDIDTGRQLPWVQAIYAAPYFALAQYGSPDAILSLTRERHPLDYVDAMRRYARSIAHAEKGDTAGFARELAGLESAVAADGVKAMENAGFPGPLIVRLAASVAKGRLAMAQGRYDEAIGHFSDAAERQKAIPYNEPPFWYYPVNQSLAAAHYKAGQFAKARSAFRAALFDAPNNALALYGLMHTEQRLGNRREAEAARRAFRASWMGNDHALSMTRL